MKQCLAWIMILLILISTTGCKKEEIYIPELKEPISVQMDTAKVKIGEIENMSAYGGEIRPYVEALSFVTEGNFGNMEVDYGEEVKKGQVLATLEQEEILNAIESLEKEIADIRKTGELQERLLNVNIAIAEEELIVMKETDADEKTRQVKELEIQKLQLDLNHAKEIREFELQKQQKELDSLREKTVHNQIIAPFNGRIVYINSVKSGAEVSRNTPMICIADESRLRLVTDYIQSSLITEAQRVYAKIGLKEYEISTVLPEEKIYGSDKSEFVIDAKADHVESGQLVTVVIIDVYKDEVLTIPINTLFKDDEGYYVYRMENNLRTRCNVTVGVISNTEAEIVAGLQEGDVVYVKP